MTRAKEHHLIQTFSKHTQVCLIFSVIHVLREQKEDESVFLIIQLTDDTLNCCDRFSCLQPLTEITRAEKCKSTLRYLPVESDRYENL